MRRLPVLLTSLAALTAAPLQEVPPLLDLPFSVPLRRPDAGREVLVFEHATHDVKFPGWVFRAGPGLCNTEAGFADDDASAVYVPPGMKVRLHDSLFPDVHPLELGPGMHDLADHAFNDLVSCIEVLAGDEAPDGEAPQATLRGPWSEDRAGAVLQLELRLAPLRPSLYRGVWQHPQASAREIEVPEGYVAVLTPRPDGLGPAEVLGPGSHPLPPGFDARVGALRICPTSAPPSRD